MIVKEFNNGWGDNFELRRFEKGLLNTYLRNWRQDDHRCAIVNSTWYNQEYHSKVLDYLQKNPVDRIVLVSFMDPAIVQANWFAGVPAEIRSVGYYPGIDCCDIWALIIDRYFQDTFDVNDASSIDTAFLCYNRKPHHHRRRLVKELEASACLQHGVITMGDASGQPLYSITNDVKASVIAPNPDQYGIVNDIMSLGPEQIWCRCFLNIVTETVFDVDQQWFVSEKIYKPVIGSRPFLVYAPNGARKWLSYVGIQDYLGDFSDISDLDLSIPGNIASFLSVLAQQPVSYLQKKYQDLQPKISHNKQMFLEHVICTKQKMNQGIQ